nr:hypothetical protein [Tanacetum cinerariifolium]
MQVPVSPTTDEQRLARKNELKACGTLLMALPDKHQLKFNSHKDAKIPMEAIEKRFSLDQIHDRLQKLVSQLEIHGVSLSQEYVNLKFLRSLPSEWKTHTLIWRNKADLEEQNLDDFTTDSVSAAASVSAACVKLSASLLLNVDSLSSAVIYSFFASQSTSPQFDNEDLKQIDVDELEEIDLRWQIAIITMRARRVILLGSVGLPRIKEGLVQLSHREALSQLRPQPQMPWSLNVMVFKKAMFDCENYYSSESDCEPWPPSNLYDRFQPSGGYHAVPPPYKGTFMPPKPDLVFNTALILVETDHRTFNVQLSPTKPEQDLSHTSRPSAPIIEDWVSDSEDESEPKDPHQSVPSFAQSSKHVKTPRHSVQPIETTFQAATHVSASPKSNSSGKRRNRKACFVCKSVDHLIKDCNFHAKKMAKPVQRNYANMGYHKQYAPEPLKHSIPTAVLTQFKPVSNNVVRLVSAVLPYIHVTRPRHANPVVTKSKSPIRRQLTCNPSSKTSNSPPRVNVVQVPVVSAAQGKQGTWGNPQLPLQDKGVIDSGCSRHMTGNMSYLSDFEELNGGYVAFGGNPNGGKITSKGKIKTSKLDFDNVYFVKELKFNLFSISQMCDKKNSGLFTDTECLVLSSDFKLPDKSQVLLRVPRENNMYNVNLKNIVPSGGLTYLFSKATLDKSNLWHRRFAHVNFKTLNKLVKGNLVRGLPTKVFENNHTCVACKKCKQHKASCKTKPISSVDQPLFRLHMDLFGPTFVKILNMKSYCLVITDDYSRFTWVFFLASKDETSPILKTFITGLKNQLSLTVKVIKSDNETEFKNSDLNQFYGLKGIKRKFSVPRTPQQNGIAKVLVTKPHNKTPYELLHGRSPSIGFMRPFGCLVTILNTLDHLGKFQGKETLHVNFLENKPNVAGTGPTWRFHIDSLSGTMNYHPVIAGNQTNSGAGFQDNLDAELAGEEVDQSYMLFPVWSSIGFINPQNNAEDAAFNGKEHDFDVKMPESKDILSPSSSAQSKEQDDKIKKEAKGKRLEDIIYSDDEDVVGTEADFKNLESSIPVSPIPTTSIHKNHLVSQIIGDLSSTTQTRSMTRAVRDQGGLSQMFSNDFHTCMFACFLSQEEPNRVKQKEDGIFISQDKYVAEILRKFGLTEGKSASTPIDTEKPSLKDPDGEDVDVHIYRSMIGSPMYLTSSRPDIMFAVSACARFQMTPKALHLHEVKQIFRYLKGKPDLGLWYPKDSPFDLVAYSEYDYAGASLDRKSTTGGCAMNSESTDGLWNRLGDLSTHTITYISPALTQKVFANMRRVGKRFSGVEMPLFEGMLVVGEIAEHGDEEEQDNDDNDAQGANANVSVDDVAQNLEITKLKTRVKKLEMANKVKTLKLRRLRKVAEIQADIYHIDMNHPSKVLSMHEEEPEVQEVVEVVTTAKLITEVVVAASAPVSAASTIIPAAEPNIPAAIVTTAPVKVAVASTRRRRRVVIRDPEEESSAKTSDETKSKDKGKGIMVEEPKPMKKKQQVKIDKAYARKLHEELNQDIDSDVTIDHVKQKAKEDPFVQRYQVMKKRPQTEAQARRNMITYLKNTDGFRLDYFKGMSYDDIRPIFKAKFNANMEFLLKSKEKIEEEENRALESINETPAQKAAKRRRLNQEDKDVEEIKQPLEIVPDEDDDVYTEATLLARKVPIMDYQIIHLNNKPHYKIIRADGTHQLYVSFITLLKNFDREDLESLWSLVKERFSTSKPNNFSDDYLLTTLRAMFRKPDGQDNVWKSQRTNFASRKEIPTFEVYIRSNAKRSETSSGRADLKKNTKCFNAAGEELSAVKHKLMLLDTAAEE